MISEDKLQDIGWDAAQHDIRIADALAAIIARCKADITALPDVVHLWPCDGYDKSDILVMLGDFGPAPGYGDRVIKVATDAVRQSYQGAGTPRDPSKEELGEIVRALMKGTGWEQCVVVPVEVKP